MKKPPELILGATVKHKLTGDRYDVMHLDDTHAKITNAIQSVDLPVAQLQEEFEVVPRRPGHPRIHQNRQAEWKRRTGFEQSPERKKYKAQHARNARLFKRVEKKDPKQVPRIKQLDIWKAVNRGGCFTARLYQVDGDIKGKQAIAVAQKMEKAGLLKLKESSVEELETGTITHYTWVRA